MQSQQAGDRPRTVWILTHRRLGDLNQMLALARALGWPATVKRLAFRLPKLARAPFAARRLIDWSASDPLEPPWPDLVICAEARTSTVARLVKERSRGKVRTLCLGRPAGSPAGFDLVLTTAQYRLPAAPNVIDLILPLPPDIAREMCKAAAAAAGAPAVRGLARPLIAVLVGGTSPPDVLNEAAASVFAAHLLDYARRLGGTLLLVMSPRTGKAATAALAEFIPAPHVVHLWQGGDENQYWHVLREADEVVVTSDSVSMASDALGTGKPVSIYRLPQRYALRHRVVEGLYSAASGSRERSRWLKPVAWLFDSGLIEVRPDRRLLFDRLVTQGRLAWFGKGAPARQQSPLRQDAFRVAALAVHQLFGQHESLKEPPQRFRL